MKRTSSLRILFCLALAFAMVFSLSAVAFADGDTEGIDPQLVGEWYCYNRTDDGTYTSELFYSVRNLNIILPNGVFTDSDTFEFASVGGYDQLIVSAVDGKTDLGERLIAYCRALSEIEDADVDEDVLDELDKLSDVEVTYELSDLSPEDITGTKLVDSEIAALEVWENDGLQIHVTATYKPDPLTSKKVDSTWYFYRRISDYRFLEALLCGEWTDQNGNAWVIGYEADEDGYATLCYTMTASDGTEFKGDYLSCLSELGEDNEIVSTVRFDFDSFESPRYLLGEFTADSVELLSDDGDLILTRS